MAIDDLPLPVVNLLNVIGVPWPYIDEDTLREFATLTRDFATAVQGTHDDATQAVRYRCRVPGVGDRRDDLGVGEVCRRGTSMRC
jgi:hypothetical protein